MMGQSTFFGRQLGQTVFATINAMFTDQNKVTGSVSRSPTNTPSPYKSKTGVLEARLPFFVSQL